MIPNTRNFLRVASLFAVLAAGSCAAPINDADGLYDDPIVNHPIQVQPSYHTLKLPFSAPDAGLMPDDAQHFDAFVADFLAHGNGAISISAPAGRDASAAISYFGERLANAGIPRDRILVGTRDIGDGRVELGYIGYQVATARCGDWSTNLGDTASNRVSPNLGCAVQQNIAAQVADPRDLVGSQPLAAGDAARRATVYDAYRQGKPTGAEHSTDQSGAIADVNK
ncbi:MAG TPA: CpaD family pilus assembly protein [Rhizomicrobium sp.]|jgi:pilus assembly protein CpaD|nr:CpaD family pilus assembly protein [Rhizomicrobium sp.]